MAAQLNPRRDKLGVPELRPGQIIVKRKGDNDIVSGKSTLKQELAKQRRAAHGKGKAVIAVPPSAEYDNVGVIFKNQVQIGDFGRTGFHQKEAVAAFFPLTPQTAGDLTGGVIGVAHGYNRLVGRKLEGDGNSSFVMLWGADSWGRLIRHRLPAVPPSPKGEGFWAAEGGGPYGQRWSV